MKDKDSMKAIHHLQPGIYGQRVSEWNALMAFPVTKRCGALKISRTFLMFDLAIRR